MNWPLKARTGPQRCALCHDFVGSGETLLHCPCCGTSGHQDCFLAEGACPTNGCPARHDEALLNAGPKRLSMESVGLEGRLSEQLRPRTVERRVLRSWRLKRLLSFLGLSIHDIINDPRNRRRLRSFFKMQRMSERHGEQQRQDVEDDYKRWLEDQL